MGRSTRGVRWTRTLAAAAAVLAGCVGAWAGNIVNENFEGYSSTPFLLEESDGTRNADKGTGFTQAWDVLNSQWPDANVVAKSMSFSGSGFSIVGGNKALRVGPGIPSSTLDNVVLRRFNTQAPGDVWFSFLLETGPNTAKDDGNRDMILVAFDDATPATYGNTLSVLVDDNLAAGEHTFRARAGGSANTALSSVVNVPGTAYFVVGRLSQDGSGNYNTVDLYVDPATLSQPTTPDATATATLGSPLTSIGSVRLVTSAWEETAEPDEVYIDEFRVGRTYNDVLARYENIVREDGPVVYFRLNETSGNRVLDTMLGMEGTRTLDASLSAAGPRAGGLESNNSAAAFDGAGDRIAIPDPGAGSILDFGGGDPITLEAWVKADAMVPGSLNYIISKGRNTDNVLQNYGLRLRGGSSQTAAISFLYRNAADTKYHIWDSSAASIIGDGLWHQLVLTYEFGDSASIHGYIDGEEISGGWNAGYGQGDEAPYESDQDLWFASSQNGAPGGSFDGLIDEVAIYDRILAANEIREHYIAGIPEPATLSLLGLGGLALLRRRRRA